ncbi:hypothetical protein HYU14_05005, partial [Candidatus Woesearchaeota archaeon]|nr:hypothetical protein [Candidatus Woesearchaeota archaeon]
SARAFGKLILAPAIGVKIRFKLIGSLANRGTPEVIRQLVGNAYAPFSFLKQRRFGEAAKVNVWLLAGLSGLTLLAYLLKLLMTGVPESHEAGDHTTGLIDDLEATQGQLEEDAAKVNNAANLSEIGTLIDEADRIRESGETTPPSASPLEAPSEHPESPIGIAALISPYEAEAIARLLNDSTNEDGKIFSKVELFKAGDKNLPLFIFLSDTHHGSFESVVDSIWGKMGQASNQEEFLDALNNFGQNLEDSSEEDLVEINEALRIAKPGFLGCEGWAGKASSQILNGEKEVLEKFLGNEVEGVVPSEVNEIQRIRQQGGFPLIGLEEEEIQEAALINEAEKFHIIQSYASVFLKAMIFHAAPGTDFSDEKSQVLKMRNMVISQIADLKPEHATAPSWEETKQFLEGEGLGRIGRISPRLGSFFESELKKIAEFEQELTQQRERAIQLNNSAKKENEVAKKAQENLQSLRQKAEEARADLERAKGAFENHRGERSIPDEIKRYERFNKIKKEITKISDAVNKGGPEQFAQEGLKIVEEIKRLAREKNEITGTGRSARNIRESIEENITDTKVIGEALRLMFADIEEFNQAKSRVSRVLRQEKEAREEDNAHKRHIEGKRRDWQKELAEARQKTQDISKAAEAHFDAMQEPMEEIADELTVGRRDDIVAKKLLDGMSNSPRKVSLVFFGDDHIQSIIGKLRGQMECHVIVLDDKEDEGGETAPSQRPGNNMHEGTPPAGRNTTPANNIQEAASSSTIPPQSPQHTGIPASEAEKQTGPGAEIARKLNVSGEDISLGQKDPIEARLLRGEIVPGKELAQAYVQKEVEEFLEVRKAETKAGLMFKWRLASKTAERIYSHINGLTPQEIEKRFLNGADVDDRLMPLIKTTLVFNALLKNDGGQLQYLKNAGNIGDTLTTGRFQCQSGTDLFLCLAFHLLEEGELKDFVDVALIQKDGIGHEKPGMIINNSLITMEITSAGINICYDGNLRALGGPIVITKAVEGMVDKMDKIYNPALKSIRLIRGMKPYSPLASPPPGFKFPKSLPDIYWPGEQGEVIVPEQQPDELKELNKEYEAECRKIMETLKRKQDLAEGIFTVDIKQDFEPEAGEDAKKAPELDWKAALEELSKVKDDETLLSNMALSLTRDGKVMPLGPGTNITIPEGGLQGNEGGESGAQPSSGQQEGIRNWGKDIKKIYEETKDDPNLTGFKQYYGNKPGCPHGFTYGGFLNDPDAPRDTQGNIKTPDNPGQTISVFFHRHWYEEKETLGVKLDFYLDGKFIESKYTLLNAIKIDGRSEDAFFIKDGKKIEFKVETKRLQ